MIKNTITTIGGATKDIMYYTKDAVLIDNKKDILRKELIGFEYGAKVYSKKVYITFGGGGANTAVGIVIVCAVDANVISNTILPSVAVAGQLVNDNVIDALDVIVW